ncbi:hypothetical protein DT594_00325 [Halopseudomonas laoshanensis]|uniref:Lipoprotein n=1 Tax=Halopseudomonas laoshanensis TaxID=2268758 RepID=A0A7V7KVY8_9GAMM|nr:hypothetical protein [Halopseudomonas laoshanensis]KAA0695860.1 hypothetical protein DT594_00325 [Halopseudomonas laoshanensis]
MKKCCVLVSALGFCSVANAGIPLFNATCPGEIEVHADQGGAIYINGKEAELTRFSDTYYEAKGGAVTISLMINPDGSPDVSYTGQHRANGVCAVKQD